MSVTIYHGDSRKVLAAIENDSVHCCVTSPPYWRLRDYGTDNQIGMEESLEEYIDTLVHVFTEVKRVLRPDGTLWLNLGDSYIGSGKGNSSSGKQRTNTGSLTGGKTTLLPEGLKAKDLAGMPWRIAFALQKAGWFLRSDIIWNKPNPMPESVKDRPTRSHEYVFLLSKSARYYYDYHAVSEPLKGTSLSRLAQNVDQQHGSSRAHAGNKKGGMKAVLFGGNKHEGYGSTRHSGKEWKPTPTANKKSVWTIASSGFKEAHFATFPSKLIEPCIKAGCPEGGIVLDPFFGAGTTGLVATRLNRHCIGIELNEAYVHMAHQRIRQDGGLLADVSCRML